MSSFDAETFLSQQTTAEHAVKMQPIPEGEYTAQVRDVAARQNTSQKTGQDFVSLDITWEIIGQEELAKKLNRQQLLCRQSMILDITKEGTIAEGENKNVKLGRLRAAVGQNTKGKPWSPMQLKDAPPATIVVAHRPDRDDPEVVYDEVRRVAKA